MYPEMYPILAKAVGDCRWHQGARCGGCQFLERLSLIDPAIGLWRCTNAWRSLTEDTEWWNSYHIATDNGYMGHHRLLGNDLRYHSCKANPGRFACWLFRPGESLSARAFRDGHWPEYLALKALGGQQ